MEGEEWSSYVMLSLSTHSLPILWGSPTSPLYWKLSMRSTQEANKDATPTGSVHKSRGDRVVCIMCAVK